MAAQQPQKRQQNAPPVPPPVETDYMHNFIANGRFPIYKYSNLRKIVDTNAITVEKIPMFVDGNVVWTHFRVIVKPTWRTDPYSVDIDIRLTILEGQAWLLLEYKKQPAGSMVEAGDIVIIPAGASYTILNLSRNENCIYTLDANALLEME